ncbi:MAG: EAL domain-containing protein [Betaproteobacteria bacterium]|nr:EAL domain-containing protein [Betaproteobacteria bacterium]
MIPENRLRAFLEAAPDAFFVHDLEGRITDVNRKACTLTGYSREELLSMRILDLEQDFDPQVALDFWLRAQPGETFSFPGHHRRKDGSIFPVEVHLSVMVEQGRRTMLALIHDASRRREIEAQRERQTRLYEALSEINQAIVRMEDNSTLYPLVCRVAVDYGGMKVAWIGECDAATGYVTASAAYGSGIEYLKQIVVSIHDTVPEGRGPSGTAWRERRSVVVNRFQESDMTAPWRPFAIRYGWGSVGAFPILRAQQPVAVLVVYHEHPEAFDDNLVRLLDEMVRDISFALDNFDRERERRQTLALLEENEARLRLTLEAIGIGVWDWDLVNNTWQATPIYFQMLGYPPMDGVQPYATWKSRVHPEDLAQVSETLDRVRDQGREGFDIQFRIRCADGRYRWVHNIGRVAAFSRMGRPMRMLGLQIDVTQTREMLEALRLSEEKFFKVFSNLPNPVSITRLDDGLFVDVNDAWVRFVGYSRKEALGRTSIELGIWVNPEDRVRIVDELQRRGRVINCEATVRSCGQEANCLISAETIQIGGAPHIVMAIQDITEKRRYDELIWRQANFDLLTELPNRYMFYDRLDQAIKKAHRDGNLLGLLFIDLDRFKEVNDSLGHHVGDQLLVEMAQRIRDCVRETDTVARLGGDEFTVALPSIRDAEFAEKVAQSILRRLSEAFTLEQPQAQVFISASIGVTLYPLDAQDVDQMLKNADQAMYAAKKAGRNRLSFFTPALQDIAEYRLRMHNDLRLALERSQFEMHYQPIVAMATGQVVKAEALLRWNHPQRGLVGPGEFVPLAEESGLIVEIGDWVFRQVAQQMNQWKHHSTTLQVSVNMSPLQFHGEAVSVQEWLEHLRLLGLSGEHLAIEITEGLLLSGDSAVAEKLQMFRDADIELAIDDFGTGYSSLSYLSKYPISYLKIDQVFVRNLAQDANSRALCEVIVLMAHKLGLQVVAEGIETEDQRDFLRAAGCDFGQGYFYSRPLPAAAFEAFLNSTDC